MNVSGCLSCVVRYSLRVCNEISDIMAIEHLTESSFTDKIADVNDIPSGFRFVGKRPAVVDFYAAWCGPCRMMSPILEDLAVEYGGKVDFYKVDVDKEEALSSLFSIRSIPTLLLISQSGEMHRIQGAVAKSQLKQQVDDMLY